MNSQLQSQTKAPSTSSLTPAPGLNLQHKCAACGQHSNAAGECGECSNTRLRGVQAKLAISHPGDPYEREADRIAEQVMRMPAPPPTTARAPYRASPSIQRKCDHQGAERAGDPLVNDVISSSGQPLDSATRAFFEPRFGHDFSQVRVHAGDRAAESASAVNARAYTVGEHVVFGAKQFSPGSTDGRRLLAHELTHVVQQSDSDEGHVGQGDEERGLSRVAIHPMIQRDLAIEPPRPAAAGRVLTAAEMISAINLNNQVLGAIANSVDIIEMIRDVIGVSPLPAVVDEDFVNGVVQWQANFGLAQDGKLGPTTARPLFREIGAEGVGRGELQRNPRYVPAGPINVARAGARAAHFDMSAEFKSDPANRIFPSCGEIRQEIQWDAAFVAASVAAGTGAVPHGGFPAAHPANRWIEDRDPTGTRRLGHRSGRFSEGIPGNRYLDSAGRANQAFGHRYEGRDDPTGFATDRGSWSFRLRAIDVCNGDQQLAVSPTLVVNWL